MSVHVFGPINSGAAVGGDGVATANSTSDVLVKGLVEAVHITYNHSPPAGTTDVTVATAGASGIPAVTLLTVTDAAVEDATGTDVTYDATNEIYERFAVYDKIKVTIAQANALDHVDVVILYST
jgi:hypothetical protein